MKSCSNAISGFFFLLLVLAGWLEVAWAAEFDNADAYYEDALGKYRTKDFNAAIIQLKNALQLNEEHLPAKILLGESLLGSGEAQAAEAQLLRARKEGADENLVAIPIANSLLSQSKYVDLENYIARARRSAKIDSKLQVILGIAYTQQQEFTRASEAFNKARQLDPGNPEPLLAQGSIALNNDELEKVEELVQLVENISPGNTDLLLLKGDLHTRKNRHEHALRTYNEILQINPESVTAILRRARILLNRGEYEKIIADLKPLWEDELYDPEAIYLYSIALARSGNTEFATRVLEEASQKIDYFGANIVDKHPTLALLSATIAYHRGDKLKALEAAKQLIEKLPSHGPTRMLLARIYMDLGQHADVLDALEPVKHRNQGNFEFMSLYGRAQLELNQYSNAIQSLQTAAALNSNPASLLREISLARLAAGKTEEAIRDLEKAYMAGTYDTPSAVLLASITLSSGNLNKAREIARTLLIRDSENPVVHNLAGTIEASTGDIEQAKQYFQDAIVADNNYIPAIMNLVKFDLREQRLTSAEMRLQHVLEVDQDSREGMAGMAKLSEMKGDMYAASEWLEKLWLRHPEAKSEIFQLVRIYQSTERGDQALRTIEKLQQNYPRDFEVLMNLLDTQLSLGKRNEAVDTLNRRLRYTVDFNVAQLTELAKVQVSMEDLQGAHGTLTRCLVLEPGFEQAKIELVKLETRLRNYDRALQLAEEIIATNPDSALGYSLKGDVLVFANREDEALEIFQSTLKKWPSTSLHLKIIKQNISSNSSIEVLAPLREWVSDREDDMEARFGLAVAYIDIGAFEEAIKLHLSLLDKLPGDASIHNNLAWLYQNKSDRRALKHAERAFQIAPNDPDILDTYGWVLAETGELDSGLSFIRKALSRASTSPAARYHLALVLSKLGRENEARDTLRELLAENRRFRESQDAIALLERLEKG